MQDMINNKEYDDCEDLLLLTVFFALVQSIVSDYDSATSKPYDSLKDFNIKRINDADQLFLATRYGEAPEGRDTGTSSDASKRARVSVNITTDAGGRSDGQIVEMSTLATRQLLTLLLIETLNPIVVIADD